MRVFVTGSAGFIGFHVCRRLLAEGHTVTGFDGMTPYYDVNLKVKRHELLEQHAQFTAYNSMLEDELALQAAFSSSEPDLVIHLAAQAGVRYSLEHPKAYIDSNLVGSFNLLEIVRRADIKHLLFASTSSVYGGNVSMPFSETDNTDMPVSLYAATKRSGEAMSHSYAHLWKIPTTCIRFFTVYGPWGRPDMALFKFVKAIVEDTPIDIYGNGNMRRDFTYIDDLVEAINRLKDKLPVEGVPIEVNGSRDSLSAVAPWRVVNIAGGAPVGLMPFVETIEECMGKVAQKKLLPMQKGDVEATWADPALLKALTGSLPKTDIETGVAAFVEWYGENYSS